MPLCFPPVPPIPLLQHFLPPRLAYPLFSILLSSTALPAGPCPPMPTLLLFPRPSSPSCFPGCGSSDGRRMQPDTRPSAITCSCALPYRTPLLVPPSAFTRDSAAAAPCVTRPISQPTACHLMGVHCEVSLTTPHSPTHSVQVAAAPSHSVSSNCLMHVQDISPRDLSLYLPFFSVVTAEWKSFAVCS